MEGGDSESEEDGVEYSGMEQPPLTKMLKNILSEYPDDGQILKELIQNAEDAEAKEVKVLLDSRRVNTKEVNPKKRPYYKYFKGPALYFYNDALFSETDWRGIKMLYSSVKELDPLKVGRFGLGFKSVFHITDYPMVISNDKMLIIDPHQTDPGKVCQTIKLKNISRCRKMYIEDCMAALDGIFGFSQDTIENGYFGGSLFRFPFRSFPTELSDNLYTESKLNDLFHAFECEASITLLFLKFLHKMELYVCKEDGVMDKTLMPRFAVTISGPTADDVIKNRNQFSQNIKALNGKLPSSTITCTNWVNIRTEKFNATNQTDEKTWLVVNAFHGGSLSPLLKKLSHDEDLSYSPCVGIAAPMLDDPDFKGHVFCFLPLPLEPKSLTGFPVHVNGYFALSQNRRHVKWPSADQIGKHGHLDKSMQWNECLVREVLSEAYLFLLDYLIKKCDNDKNPKGMVAMVYRMIPPIDTHLNARWKIILPPVVDKLLQRAVFFSDCNGGKWIHLKDVVFARFDPGIGAEIQETVKTLVRGYKRNLVDIPQHIWELVTKHVTSPCYLTPDFVTLVLHSTEDSGYSYTDCSVSQKLQLLEFLVSRGRYSNLADLKLLPLENGAFVEFGNAMERIFSCNTEIEKQICCCFQDRIRKMDIPANTRQILQEIAKSGTFQLSDIKVDNIKDFIKKTISTQFYKRSLYMEWDFSSCAVSENWIECVWKYIAIHSLESFKDLSIVPVKLEHSVSLYKLSDLMILESNRYSAIPAALSKALKKFSVVILPKIPDYMEKHSQLMQYIKAPNTTGVLDVIANVYNDKNFQENIERFNSYAASEERMAFIRYLEDVKICGDSEYGFLCEIEIFKKYQHNGFVCIKNVETIAPTEEMPVRFPRKLISGAERQVDFAKSLGAKVIGRQDMIFEMLTKRNCYNSQEINALMAYFLKNLELYKSRQDIMKLAAQVPFVPNGDGLVKRASDLYDPESKWLKCLLLDLSNFPDPSFCTDQTLNALRNLGLKSEHDVTAEILNECAVALDQVNKQGSFKSKHKKQAECIFHFLNEKDSLSADCVHGNKTLKTSLCGLHFVPPLARPSNYPTVLPWCGTRDVFCSPQDLLLATEKNQKLIGCIMPLVSEKIPEKIANLFGWDRSPPIDKVFDQLFKIVSLYQPQYKPEILSFLKEIYLSLASSKSLISHCQGKECVWTGNGFVTPDRVFVRKLPGDINVEPYVYCIPKEFEMSADFFISIGCMDHQTNQTLQNVLTLVQQKHHTCVRPQEDVKRDLSLVVHILNHLKENFDQTNRKDILFPIHNGDDSKLIMKPASECHYCNAEWLQDIAEDDEDEEIVFVHANIPHDTAEKLGVRSLTESLFSDAIGMEEWGQSEKLTQRIKQLLKGYKDGFSVPKEIVQNADDAGASEVRFLYDERENLDFRTRLIDEKMSECQGPALWAYNNAMFSRKDLENITKVGGATKETDTSKIGKFGLGFCSVYNLTEVPSFVTGNDVVIFDPHSKYLGKVVKNKQTGIKINLGSMKNKKLVQRMKNQFQPFQGVFDCYLGENFTPYQGTLFRFPLRTSKQALESAIDNTAYTKEEMKKLIRVFIEAAGSLLLFSQNVIEIKFYHLQSDEINPEKAELIYSVCKTSPAIPHSLHSQVTSVPQTSILKNTTTSLEKFRKGEIPTIEKRSETNIFTINVTVRKLAKELSNISDEKSQSDWIVSWATGTDKSQKFVLRSSIKGMLHLASVAIHVSIKGNELTLKPLQSSPFGFYKESRFFCFMPLPIVSPLPVHVNAAFAVSSDRRSLCSKTSDDKYSFESDWNDALMSDAVPRAYILLLESLREFIIENDENYEMLWPTTAKQNCNEHLLLTQRNFYGRVVEENYRIFKRANEWFSFPQCRFIKSSLLQSEIGNIVMDAAIHFEENQEKKIMSISESIAESFTVSGMSDYLQGKLMSEVAFFETIFFPNIHSPYWSADSRNRLVLYVLDNMVESLHQYLQDSACIPTEPNGRLRRPVDLVHPNSKFTDLFSIDEERFIAKLDGFDNTQRLRTLEGLGMMRNTFPLNIVKEQACSIEQISCSKCRLKRTITLLEYLHQLEGNNESLLSDLQGVPFLPVLEKSNEWFLPWKADSSGFQILENTTCQLCNEPSIHHRCASACLLYHPNHKYLLGSQVSFVNTEILPHHFDEAFFAKLGVKGCNYDQISVDDVCQQLMNLSEHFNPEDLEKTKMRLLLRICGESYQFLDDTISSRKVTESIPPVITQITQYPILLIDSRFVYAEQVAMALPYDCSPYLFTLPSYRQNTNFLKAIGVKKHFSLEKIIQVSLKNQELWNDKEMTVDALELLKRLMELLTETMKRESKNYMQLQELIYSENAEAKLCLPNRNAQLVPVSDLCIDDDDSLSPSKSMKFVHGSISHQVASLLGVKSKERQYIRDHIKKRSFGQKEELTERIRRILSGYPCDEGILKELLQNADDANASEIHFVIDFKRHSCAKVFDDKWKALQGPALLVYNDSTFTDDDIEGIQKLGTGSKGHDPTKTGQYGVGFNAVYHLTDVPSFITKGPDIENGETLCVMDPNCSYCDPEKDGDPGVQFTDLKDLRNKYEDVFAAYHEKDLLIKSGTVFRFPLRTEEMATKSKIKSKSVGQKEIFELVEKFKKSMFESLLFLKSVRKITISEIKNNRIVQQYTVEASISEENEKKLQTFSQHVKSFSWSVKSDLIITSTPSMEISYTVDIEDNKGRIESWLLVQRIGVNKSDSISPKILEAYSDGSLGLLPLGSIALPIISSKGKYLLPCDRQKCDGYAAFCFLPLPFSTGLPFHVNGYFCLDHEARRNLWQNKVSCYRSLWNNMVLELLVAPCYVTGLCMIKEDILKYQSDHTQNETMQVMEAYHSLFPCYENAKHDYWKLLISTIFTNIYDSELHVLPSYVSSPVKDEGKISVTFFPIMRLTEIFSATYFEPSPVKQIPSVVSSLCSTILGQNEQKNKANNEILETVLKRLGLRIINSPHWVFQSFEKAGRELQKVTPEYVITFLKSYNEATEYKCRIKIDADGTNIDQTEFRKLEDLKEVVKFCQKSNTFENEIFGLPFCLTEDLTLHIFSENSIFCSRFVSVLPMSHHLFLHNALVHSFARYSEVFRPFNLETFTEHLADNQQSFKPNNKYASYRETSLEVPNKSWLKDVWTFIETQVKEVCDPDLERSAVIKCLLQKLGPWYLIPCRRRNQIKENFYETQNILLQVKCISEVLDFISFDSSFKASFENLQLPSINILSLPTSSVLTKVIPGAKFPSEVLRCLYCHRQSIDELKLNKVDCNNILTYIANNIQDILTSENKREVVDMIKSLKLHITIHENCISLDEHLRGLVLPSEIPSDGIEIWAEKSKIVLIKQNQTLRKLYEILEYEDSSIQEFYSQHILQMFALIPSQHYLEHIAFIKDTQLRCSLDGKYNKKQTKLIEVLKTVPFINIGSGIWRCASEFYSPHDLLLKEMCDDSELLPEPYCKDKWKAFMELLGLKKEVTEDLFIKFAKTVERIGFHDITPAIKQKSTLLLENLKQRISYSGATFFQEIATVRFLVPYCVGNWRKRLCASFQENTLICFSQSVSQKYKDLIWTSCCLIPDSVDSSVLKKVMCNKEPPVEKVTQHLQNISIALHKECKKFDANEITKVLAKIYDYVLNHQQNVEQKLGQTPIVFLPDRMEMVTCDRVVLYANDSDLMAPYLYRAPLQFGMYFSLFEKLGASSQLTLKTFAVVLQNLQMDLQHHKDLHINEKAMIKKAVDGFFKQLYEMKHVQEKDIGVPKLFLPTKKENLSLLESTKVIFSDSDFIQSRIKIPNGLSYFVGFKKLEIDGKHTDVKVIKSLPDLYRPHILSEMVDKKISFKVQQMHGGYITMLQEFINSHAFVEGVVRLIVNESKMLTEKVEIKEDEIIASLKQIHIIEVANLQKEYVFQGSTIGHYKMQSAYEEEIENGSRKWKFYAVITPDTGLLKWIDNIEVDISDLLSSCTGYKLSRGSLISKMLQAIETPDMISEMLDKWDITEYSLGRQLSGNSIFEKLGSFVQPQWHHILDNSFREFDVDEYVAILLEDGGSDSDDDIYIYAQVIEKLQADGNSDQMSISYRVLLDHNKTDIKKGFELYKFNRKPQEVFWDIVISAEKEDGEKEESERENKQTPLPRSLHEIYREIREQLIAAWTHPSNERNSIIRRLSRRWHPDKNIGNEEQATKAFQYIQQIVAKLEKGERVKIDDDVESQDQRFEGPGDFGWSSFFETFFSNIHRQCNRERRRYEDFRQRTRGRRRERGYRPSYRCASPEPVPHVREARRWYQQACSDIEAAKELNRAENANIYNWICYICHQGAEKALVAALYRIDANSVKRGHDLCDLSTTLSFDLRQLSQEMESLVGNYEAMRYPANATLPKNAYTRFHSQQAISLCTRILEIVNEQLL